MATINLANALVGDQYRTRAGRAVRFTGRDKEGILYVFQDNRNHEFKTMQDGSNPYFDYDENDIIARI